MEWNKNDVELYFTPELFNFVHFVSTNTQCAALESTAQTRKYTSVKLKESVRERKSERVVKERLKCVLK